MIRATVRRVVLAVLISLPAALWAQPSDAATEQDNPVLRAMQHEMDRCKARLRLPDMPAPFYIDYQVTEVEGQTAEATLGALRSDARVHMRTLRVVVRVGDYKQDSFYQRGTGVSDAIPLGDDEMALRRALWLASDQAYKAATEALSAKQARLKQLSAEEQPVDDFARAEPVRYLGALARLDYDAKTWRDLIKSASALAKRDPQIESSTVGLSFQAMNRYFLSSEGTVTRRGQTYYQLQLSATTQAADGMRLERSKGYTAGQRTELPTKDEFLAAAGKLLASLKELREAPVVEEEYRGPVLMSGDAAADIFADLIGQNVLGIRPPLGQPSRTRGAFASSYKSRVLPDFFQVVDDPTQSSLGGQSLLGSYAVDDEGVKAVRVPVVEKGVLVNYLLGRIPIRDFPTSNGHGRGPANTPTAPNLGNLLVTSLEPLSREELKKKLLERCQERGLAYGYFADTLGPQRTPRLLYRVWVKDGHEELVRGAVFGDLDTRSLRSDLIAAGGDVFVENRFQSVPYSVASPSILFEELEIKRANRQKDKLPEYPPPAMAAR
jgi:predicted Zn-dependent protease